MMVDCHTAPSLLTQAQSRQETAAAQNLQEKIHKYERQRSIISCKHQVCILLKFFWPAAGRGQEEVKGLWLKFFLWYGRHSVSCTPSRARGYTIYYAALEWKDLLEELSSPIWRTSSLFQRGSRQLSRAVVSSGPCKF